MTQTVNLIVHHRLFLDVGIGYRQIGLGLVEIVIRDEVMHRVLWKKRTVLLRELRGESLIVRNHKRGFVKCGYHVCYAKCLTRARGSEKRLLSLASRKAIEECGNGLRLVACRSVA